MNAMSRLTPNFNDLTPMMEAAVMGQVDRQEEAIEARRKINARPLHYWRRMMVNVRLYRIQKKQVLHVFEG